MHLRVVLGAVESLFAGMEAVRLSAVSQAPSLVWSCTDCFVDCCVGLVLGSCSQLVGI